MRAAMVWRAAFFAALWWAWTGDQIGSWAFGAPAVAVAAVMSSPAKGAPGERLSPRGIGRFLIYFAGASVRGGVDVAWRALSPRMRLQPGFLEYPLRLDADSASAVFFANIISLLPGTLSVRLGERSVMIHAIDLGDPVEAQLEELEARVGAVFGARLSGEQ